MLEPLGEGGMGRVFLAYDPKLHRRVAIKLLKTGKDGVRHSARLVREAQALAQLSHPNLVHVYEVGEQGDEVYVVMEYIRGQTLSDWVSERRRSWREVVAVLAGAGRGLASAHRANIVHRDFKPANVVIDREGVARVVDFGIAVLGGADLESSGLLTETKVKARQAALSIHFTEGGSVMGTPPYMAPEQLDGGRIDARTDQYSFAVTLFEALYRTRPFSDDREAMIPAKKAGEIRFPVSDSVPGRVRAVLRRALAPDPEKRFASMQELLVALESSRRAMGMIVGGSAVIVVLAGVFGLDRGGRPEQGCDAPPPRILAAWNDERRTAVAAAFHAVPYAYAEHSLQRVTSALDERAQAWIEMWRESCRATHVAGTQAEDLFELRQACLDHALDTLDATVDVLATADLPAVDRSVLAVADLTPIAVCGDEVRLRNEVPLPSDPHARGAVQGARAELARTAALLSVSRTADALEPARNVAARADELGHAPLVAEAQIVLGKALEGEPAEAEAAFRAAIHAANLGRHDLAAARAWTELIRNVGVTQKRLDEALSLATGAEAAVARIDGDGSLTAALSAYLGSIASAQGRYEDAVALYSRAESLIVDAYGPDDPRLRLFVNNLGVVHLQHGNWDDALRQFERALALGERTLGEDHPYLADYIRNIGSVYLERHDGAAARRSLERALVLLERAPQTNGRLIAVTRANLAFAMFVDHETLAARGQAREALAAFEALVGRDHPHVAGVLELIGMIDLHLGELDAGAHAFARAEAILLASVGAAHPLLATVQVHHAELLLTEGRPGQAERLLAAAEPILRRDPGEQHPDHAVAFALLAEARVPDGGRDRLATASRDLRAAIDRMRPLDHHFRARARFALAKAQHAAGDHDALATAEAAVRELGGIDDFIGTEIRTWIDAHGGSAH